ncbi:hypothetical protein [Deinococcus sp. SL84]|uniref:hypothetical protein n=1 Tax=Deinococcus sp. SL84 TaxID=2994663 RepID=UPI002273128E|nr:hypothetical protein [Deinococcus sp. SL84]MCY1704302.1 hypothetical protein [Deinococcus sp. SL84]
MESATKPLQASQDRLQNELTQLREDLSRLSAAQDHHSLNAAQFIQTQLRNKSQRLQQLVRQELWRFQNSLEEFQETANALGLDYASHADDEQWRIETRSYLAKVERAMQPLAELSAQLIHTVQPDEISRATAAEIYATVLYASSSPVHLNPYSFALHSYPAQLFLRTHATATVNAPTRHWLYFHDLLLHTSKMPSVNHSRQGILLSHLVWIDTLNQR